MKYLGLWVTLKGAQPIYKSLGHCEYLFSKRGERVYEILSNLYNITSTCGS